MIEVRDLTKIYVNGKNKLKALNSVNFKLPDKGMVFVIGKSGSGKSTLLNMLGGLDDITSGDVIIDNFSFAKMTNKELDIFRNNCLGIIYQNYNLFESETVVSNIKVGTDSLGIHVPEEKIIELLHDLDLEDIKEKKVKNLSGGQKQRVAIARALVRNPKFILADEPTGNLDSKTATIIFDVLKKISQDRLIVVISHDNKSAHKYADRILRLSDGEVVEDLIRNSKREPKLNKDFVYIAEDDEINEVEVEEINKEIDTSLPKLKKRQRAFIDFNGEVENTNDIAEIKVKHTKFRKVAKTAFTILKHNKFSLIVTTLLSILMVSLLTLATSFISFKGASAISDAREVRDIRCLTMKKGYSIDGTPEKLKKEFFVEVDESDLKPVKDIKYQGHYYPIYNIGIPFTLNLYTEVVISCEQVYEKFYCDAAQGVINCDVDYLKHVFGENLELAAGSIYGLEDSEKLIFTDYLADAFLAARPDFASDDPNDPYLNIIDVNLMNRFTIGAIVRTNYKEKFKDIYEAYLYTQKHSEYLGEFQTAVTSSEMFQVFEDDINSYLCFAYSVNPNFIDDYKKTVWHAFVGNTFYALTDDANQKELTRLDLHNWVSASVYVEGDEVLMDVKKYNAFFGTNVVDKNSPDFSEKTIYFYNFGVEQDTSEQARHIVKLEVKDVYENFYGESFLVSREKAEEIMDFTLFKYGYVFDKVTESYDVHNALHPYLFYSPQHSFEAVFNAINVINIFSRTFLSIFVVLLAILALIVVSHSLRMMKREKYRFGVYKSLGYSNKYLNASVFVANIFTVILIFVASMLVSFALSFLVNYLLQAGFYFYTRNNLYHLIRLLLFRFDYALYFNLITFAMFLVTTLIPLLKIRKVKPNNIIKESE